MRRQSKGGSSDARLLWLATMRGEHFCNAGSLVIGNSIFFAQARQFGALLGRQARLAFGPIRAGLLDPVAERRLRQAEVACRRTAPVL